MADEIERKFLVDVTKLKCETLNSYKIKQGYLKKDGNIVRVRVTNDDAYLIIKSKTNGISRKEFEYSIPIEDANYMIDTMCDSYISKTRYLKHQDNIVWEIDFFEDDNEGLVVAEVELESVDQTFKIPNWLLKEVSDEFKYMNNNLLENPYKNWSKDV